MNGEAKPAYENRTPIEPFGGEVLASERPGPPQISDDDTGKALFEKLIPGTKFVDPEGQLREKRWSISAENALEDFKKVPEGATYLDPEGVERIKPTYEGISFSAQTLYDMAVSEEEKRNALGLIYGDEKVKQDETGEHYVEDEGVQRKPSHGNIVKRAGAEVIASAAPTIGAIGGALIGGAGGTLAEPGGGTLLGGVAGAAYGGALGQSVNDLVFAMIGGWSGHPLYQRSIGQEAGNIALSAGVGAAGELGGAALRAIPPAFGAYIDQGVKGGAARFFGEFAGLQEKELQQAYRLRQQGVISRPSNYFKELPSIRKAEAFEEEFLGGRQGIYEPSAFDYMEKKSKDVLSTLGVETKVPLREATELPSSEAAGRVAIDAARFDMAYMNATLDDSILTTKAAVTGAKTAEDAGIKAKIAQHEHIAREQQAAAQTAVETGIGEIRQMVDKALETYKSDGNSGNLMTAAGNALQALLVASRKTVSKGYEAADAMTGGLTRSTEELSNSAKNFLDSMPESFRGNYPEIVDQLRRLAGQEVKEGAETEPAKEVTLGQIHNARSALRHDINWEDVTPGFRKGAMKHFQNVIDRFIHDEHAASPWKAGVKMLDETDRLYAKLIPRHEEETFAALMKGARAKMPLDPQVVADIVFRPGYTEPRRQLRGALGENLWSAIEAAHTERLLAKNRDAAGQINTVGFANDIVEATNNRARQFPEKTLKLAQDILKVEGKLQVKAEDGDTISTLLTKGRLAKEEAEKLAERDPMGELSQEIKEINKQYKTQAEALRKQGRAEPLGFLYEDSMSHKAVQAADKILGSEDLYLAAAAKWGENSPEMTALKQVFAHRLLQKFAQEPAKFRKHLQESVTNRMLKLTFGTDAETVATLVGDMEFLLGYGAEGAGTSLAGASRVLNPTAHVPGGKEGIFKIPIVGNALARVILGKMYGTFMRYLREPAGMEWLMKGLKGAPEQRETAREAWRKALSTWGPLGAGLSEAKFQEGSAQ